MREHWKVLVKAGVPHGAIRPPPTRIDEAQVRTAVRELFADVHGLERRERDALHAWLRGFRRHWPKAFERILGADGDRLLATLEDDSLDDNRYLKLKRIAVENLAGVV